MSFPFRANALVAAALLAGCAIAAAPASAAGTAADKCAAAVAKSLSKCTKKVIGIHASCYKSTGDDCLSGNTKLASALAGAQSGVADKCPDAVVEEAGYGPYTGLNLGRHFKEVCARQAEHVTDRTFARDGSLYDAADADGKKCIVTAAKEAGKYMSAALGVLSKCVVDGCSFDFSTGDVNEKYLKSLAKLDSKTACNFSTLIGSTTADYLGAVTTQVPSAIAAPCDPLDETRCVFPYPNDYFTTPDDATPTGQRVFFGGRALPKTDTNVQVLPTRWNETDGFSIGAMGLFSNPDIDLTVSGAAPITDVAASLEDEASIFMIDATTGERQLIWVERDQRGEDVDDQPLIIRMAKNLKENTRYIVAVRNMKNGAALPVPASEEFALYRDNTATNVLPFEARREHMEDIFDTLALHETGFVRSELYLAWDFTTQSTKSTAGRLLAMRDDAFTILGASSPAFTVGTVTTPLDGNIYKQIDGTFQVPLYLTTVTIDNVPTPGGRGSSLRVNADDSDYIPQNEGDFFTARYRCIIPNTAKTTPARISLYGHGLLGSRNEVQAGNVRDMAAEHNIIFCATDWTGFASEDFLFAASVVNDFTLFPTFIDRQHQGILNMLFLGRLMKHADGFSSNEEFEFGGNSMLDTSDIFYDGNSQGGILGGVLAAFSQDVTRFSLGVPGINYSTLLNRSVDFDDPFYALLTASYDASTDRNLLLSLAQNIWDRTDPSGHINHVLADPYDSTPTKKVLYQVAFGDHQVAPVTVEIASRSNGAYIHTPVLDPGKVVPEVDPYYGILAIPAYPFDGSAMVVWDAGNPAPPTGNVSPPEIPDTDPIHATLALCAQTAKNDNNEFTGDPHSCPRKDAAARVQKSEFLKTTGMIVDVCAGGPCIVTP